MTNEDTNEEKDKNNPFNQLLERARWWLLESVRLLGRISITCHKTMIAQA